ncbi:unnamed protein product [Lupinus luteus]|uniref:Uncharacterized protein n=1 Tax=Lupinus luteus TaxID=3873 RepID=A0AAV1Y4Y9_LUPLU
MVNFFLALLSISLSFVLTQSAPESSLITNLPGFNGTLPSKHYAGYVTVDQTQDRNLYYYFVESEGQPSKDPVVLWLNGGPGCSSLDGFVYEHGPFKFEKPKTKGSLPTLQLNPYSWSKVSNIIYLDSPAGAGFSYSKNKSDYYTGDARTAKDTHFFLLKWFELYPEFLQNTFFLSGESFAGVYVPTLADEIVKGLDAGIKPKINLKGYLIGNGITDDVFDGNAVLPYAHGLGLISDQIFEETVKKCKGQYYGGVYKICFEMLHKVNELLSKLNTYNILEPCYQPPEAKENTTSDNRLPVRKGMFRHAWPIESPVKPGTLSTWPELLGGSVICYDDEVAVTWLNNDDVRKAIHAVNTTVFSDWELCTNAVVYFHEKGSMINYHKNLTSKGYRALIYSGDHDLAVPFTGTQAWITSLGYKIVDEWRPWIIDYQVAGYTQGYEKNLTFLTIKGAGHIVPEFKPREALYFYSHFLQGLPF